MSNDFDWIAAGFDRIEGHVLDANGNIAGTTGTVTGGAAGSPGFRILGAKVAPIVAPNADAVPDTGDDAFLGSFLFPSAAVRQFQLDGAVSGLQINSYLGSGNVMQVGNSDLGFLDTIPFSPVNVALLVNSQAKSQVAGNVGQGIWSGIIVAKAQGIPIGRETFSERAAGVFRWQFIFSLADRFPWGETFNTTVHGISQATLVQWSGNYRKGWHRFTGDGATVTFGPLKYTPASTSLNDVIVYKNGYRQTTGITVNTTAKTLTFSVAPANNDVIAVYYDHVGS
jgi:hypothetical protein